MKSMRCSVDQRINRQRTYQQMMKVVPSSEHAAWTRTWACSMNIVMDMQHRHEYTTWTWTCSMAMDMQHGPRNAAWTWSCSVNSFMQLGPGQFTCPMNAGMPIKKLQSSTVSFPLVYNTQSSIGMVSPGSLVMDWSIGTRLWSLMMPWYNVPWSLRPRLFKTSLDHYVPS